MAGNGNEITCERACEVLEKILQRAFENYDVICYCGAPLEIEAKVTVPKTITEKTGAAPEVKTE